MNENVVRRIGPTNEKKQVENGLTDGLSHSIKSTSPRSVKH